MALTRGAFQPPPSPVTRAHLGALVLAVNAALPVVYRHLHESKYGTKLAEGAAYAFNEWSWLAVLPGVILSALLLPQPLATCELWPQRRWLPSGFFLLWITATVTHLYSLGHVYDFDLRRELVAPGVWALAWALCLRIGDFIQTPDPRLRHWLFMLPIDERTTRCFFLFLFGPIEVPFVRWKIPRTLKPLALRMANKLYVEPLLAEDKTALEAEQTGFDRHPDRPMIELNPVVIEFQKLTLEKWREFQQGELTRSLRRREVEKDQAARASVDAEGTPKAPGSWAAE